MSQFPTRRLRRLRRTPALREMLAQVRLTMKDVIAPVFVREGKGVRQEISSMPGQFQLSVDTAMKTVKAWSGKGVSAVLLFGIPDKKDATGTRAWSPTSAVQRLAKEIKQALPEMIVVTDLCLCEYTSHGHCGVLVNRPGGGKDVDNDATLALLGKTAVSQARAGADIVAPSAMMDGQVDAIRTALDEAGFQDTAVMSYAVKFASSLYGPFREAAESAPAFGDRRTYQMDYRTIDQAMLEADADVAEGADILMVKPAGAYLDVIADVRAASDLPLAAYQVSGEYSMIKAAAAAGWLDERGAALETLTAIKRAGADLIITYFAEALAGWL